MQLSSSRTLVADSDTASVAYRMRGKQYDFINSTVTSSEFAALHLLLEYRQLNIL